MFFYEVEGIRENPVLKNGFYNFFIKKIVHNGYFDMNEVLSRPQKKREDTFKDLLERKSPLSALYEHRYPSDLDSAKDQLLSLINSRELYDYVWNEYEYFVMLRYLFRPIKSFTAKQETASVSLDKWHIDQMGDTTSEYADLDIRMTEGIAFDHKKVDLEIINSVSRYIDLLDRITPSEKKYFFRGHSMVSFQLIPSVFRRDDWLRNEKKMYQELLINCPQEFVNLRSHIEILAEMQHYCLPTRLLDITENPLVALYFACEEQPDDLGEVILFAIEKDQIKYPQSDTVALLASLPLFTYEQQCHFYRTSKLHLTADQFNQEIKRLTQEVRMERPGFQNEVIADDLRKNVVVIPSRNNRRLAKQEGAFIICGLLDEKYGSLSYNTINDLRAKDEQDKTILCVIKNKVEILNKLNSLGINKSKIYPEIDDVADYIKKNIDKI